MIQAGNLIPSVTVTVVKEGEQAAIDVQALFKDKRVLLFAVPGAFTPTCSSTHLPGYIALADDFFAKGIDLIACLSVNDAFVMKAWSDQQKANQITMIADGGGALTQAFGLEMETGDFGGLRSKRYAMLIEQGCVAKLYLEPPKTLGVSSAEEMLQSI